MEQRRFQKYSHMCGQVIKKKVNRKFPEKLQSFQNMVVEQIRNSNVIMTSINHISHYINIQIIIVSAKSKTVELLEVNIRENLCDLDLQKKMTWQR